MNSKPIAFGLISLWWPPVRGGATVYIHRMGEMLQEMGIAVGAVTASSESAADARSDTFPVERIGNVPEPGNFSWVDAYARKAFPKWKADVLQWAGRFEPTHIVLSQDPFKKNDLVKDLRAMGIKVGCVWHEYAAMPLLLDLLRVYLKTKDWEETLAAVYQSERSGKTRHHEAEDSPLQWGIDFLITSNNWTRMFLDPLETIPSFTLHPPIPLDVDAPCESLSPHVTVSMLNPIPPKGALNMAIIVNYGDDRWTHRILKGGWGNGFETFLPLIDFPVWVSGRVHSEEYVDDIRSFYRGGEVFAFPSRAEGYGMAAAEAILCGVPTIATDLPGIQEAVGEGALMIPYTASGFAWIEGVQTVLDNKAEWTEKALKRKAFLLKRQKEQANGLVDFLNRI